MKEWAYQEPINQCYCIYILNPRNCLFVCSISNTQLQCVLRRLLVDSWLVDKRYFIFFCLFWNWSLHYEFTNLSWREYLEYPTNWAIQLISIHKIHFALCFLGFLLSTCRKLILKCKTPFIKLFNINYNLLLNELLQ